VSKELREAFPNAKHLVLGPQGQPPSLTRWLKSFVHKRPKTLVIGTTDLIHYGPNYHNAGVLRKFAKPGHKTVRDIKVGIEMPLIKRLTSRNPSIPHILREINAYREHGLSLMCGPDALIELMKFVKVMGYKGELCDYYDSGEGSHASSWVSYASLVFLE